MRFMNTLPGAGNDTYFTRGTRFLLYCHDTFGLGHVRRTLALADYFTSAIPDAEALIVTGSPVAHAFALPPRVDYIKLPAITKERNGTYRARDLNMGFSAIRDLRSRLLYETAQAYHPDVFLVDHAPQGWKGEALPALAMLKATQPHCLRALGLRDIVDASHVVRKSWAQDNIYQTLEQDYDLILVYGSQQFFDIGREYGLTTSTSERIRYCGYLSKATPTSARENAQPAAPLQQQAATPKHNDDGLIVLTAGGGGDGFPLMRAYLAGLQQMQAPPYRSVLITGPLMPEYELCKLKQMARALPGDTIRIETFLSDPLPLMRSATLVVAMAGYNTTCELLEMGQRVLLVPRTVPRQEQLLRATLLAQRGLIEMLHPDDLTPESLIERVQVAVAQPRPHRSSLAEAGITFHGQARALAAITDAMNRLRKCERQENKVVAQVG